VINRNNLVLLGCTSLLFLPLCATAQHNHDHSNGDTNTDAHASHSGGHAHQHDVISLKRVEWYGMVYLALDHNDPGRNGDTNTYMNTEGTTLGIRGMAPLDYGNRFFWQVETTVAFDEYGSHHNELGGHDSFVGLTGKYGTVWAGKKNTAYTTSSMHIDNFHHIAGDYRLMLGTVPGVASGTGGHHGGAFHVRAPDIITYKTPSLAGLTAEVSLFGLNETSTVQANGDSSAYSANLSYMRGGFMAGAAYEIHNNYDSFGNTLIDETSATMLSAMYQYKATSVGIIGETIDVSDADTVNVPNKSRDAYYLAAKHQIGPTGLMLAYGVADDFQVDDGADFVAAGGTFALGQRTQAYLVYVGVNNERQGTYGTFKISPVANGGDPSTIALGLVHSF
jgi:predicted porin